MMKRSAYCTRFKVLSLLNCNTNGGGVGWCAAVEKWRSNRVLDLRAMLLSLIAAHRCVFDQDA